MTEIWTSAWNATAAEIVPQAQEAEQAGFDGLFITDSQNLWLECWVVLTVVALATSRLRLGPFVTNPVTRHPVVTADAAASLQEVSGGRVVLGVGRGDSALAYLGHKPVPVPAFRTYLTRLQGYLSGAEVPFGAGADGPGLGFDSAVAGSRIRWLPGTQPRVPVDIAASGPKVVQAAAELADGVTFAVGADPARITALQEMAQRSRPADRPFTTSALLTVVPHPDREVARRLAAGGVASTGRYTLRLPPTGSDLDQKTRQALTAARDSYDMSRHGETYTSQAAAMDDDVVDRLAIAGPPDYCVERLRELMSLGLERIVFNTRVRGASAEEQAVVTPLLLKEVLPHLRG